MAPNPKSCLYLQSIIFLVIFTLSCYVLNCRAFYNLRFLPTLTNTKKGDHTKGIGTLKKYLAQIGYIDDHTIDVDSNDNFNHVLESAIKLYQEFYKLKPTGILDAPTIKQLSKPRCGVKDIPFRSNGTTISPQYAFSGPTWPPGKRQLTYSYPPYTEKLARPPIDSSAKQWTDKSAFDLTFVPTYDSADIKINFFVRDHGDGAPFDGPFGVLAHTFFPTDGRVHFDGDEQWEPMVQRGIDLSTVSLHELGHALGLAHSAERTAVMYAYTAVGEKRQTLTKDDLDGIHALYPNN